MARVEDAFSSCSLIVGDVLEETSVVPCGVVFLFERKCGDVGWVEFELSAEELGLHFCCEGAGFDCYCFEVACCRGLYWSRSWWCVMP